MEVISADELASDKAHGCVPTVSNGRWCHSIFLLRLHLLLCKALLNKVLTLAFQCLPGSLLGRSRTVCTYLWTTHTDE